MTSDTPRHLTKSRFKLGMECPAKLFYTGTDHGPQASYANANPENGFLKALDDDFFPLGSENEVR